MPKVIKKKPARKRPPQEDEVKSAALEALDKIKERQKQVIVAGSIIIAVIIIYVVSALYSSSMASKAYSLELESYKYYYGENTNEALPDEGRWKKALELYRKSLDIHVTPSALFYAGNCYYNLKEYDNAIREYNRFADEFSSDREILPLVLQKLASAYFKTNQNEQAFETLGRLAEINRGGFKDTALILEARHYESSGEQEKAMEKYRKIVADFPFSPWRGEAGSKIPAEEEKKAEASPERPGDATDKTLEKPEAESDQTDQAGGAKETAEK